MIISLAIQKGGCGKTTAAVNLSAFLAMRGHKTLLLDFDPQGNSTKTYLINPQKSNNPIRPAKTIKDVLIDKIPTADVICPSEVPNLFVLPSEIGLTKVEWKLMSEMEPNYQLKKLIKNNSLETEFEYIIIDSPPSLGILTSNVLCASRFVLVPVLCEDFATDGLKDLLDTIKVIQEGPNKELQMLGTFLNRYDSRLTLHQGIEADLEELFAGGALFKTRVRDTTEVGKAHFVGRPIFLYAKNSTAANDFGELFLEVLERADSLLTLAETKS